jgi:N-methylhydantoinase A
MNYRVGIDVGGTFTDLVAFSPESGDLRVVKVRTTSEDPIQGLVQAVRRLGADEDVSQILHGSTIATNAIIERKGANIAYVTTSGFEDNLFLQRANRRSHYDVSWIKPKPLVRRRNCFQIDERQDYKGEVLRPLSDDDVIRLADAIKGRGDIEAVAVCLLFSYVSPRHEQRIKELLSGALPGIPISISYEVHPKWKEYERASTTVADAYIKPLVGRYAARLQEVFAEHGIARRAAIMKSNGGQMTVEAVRNRPVETVLSGPAGGVVASRAIGELLGSTHLVSLDMGGTSTDVCTIVNGREHFTTNFEIEWGVPIQVPMIDIRSIGAGGGSIAWVDKGGMLRVGPQSAGAAPGPAAYGLGGNEATVTDANLVLGRLNPDYFLGGELRLDVSAATEQLKRVGQRLGMDLHQAALAIVRVANHNMIAALRMVLLERGLDPRDFALVAFGGAGPLHAADLIQEMGIPSALIPFHPGAFSAFGFLMSDARVDSHRTVQMTSEEFDLRRANQVLLELKDNAVQELRQQGYGREPAMAGTVAMRYLGQNYELEVPVPGIPLRPEHVGALCQSFHRAHEEKYGFHVPDEPMEIVDFQMTAIVSTAKPELKKIPDRSAARPIATRPVFFASGFLDTPIYRRVDLAARQRMEGPLVVEEPASTTVVLPGQLLEVGQYGEMVIR